MDWKTNGHALAEKLITAIDKEGELSLDTIDARAVKHGISMMVLDRALELLHKNKHIERRVRRGTVVYSIKVVKEVTAMSHLAWLRENYPYPTDFVMPFPEIDMSWLVLKPTQLQEYKAMAKGRGYVAKKGYEYSL